MDSELLLIALTTINGYVTQNTETACYYTKNHLLKFIHLLVGGNLSKLVYLTPHPSWVGGNLSQLVYLAPHPDFWAVNGYGFWITVNSELTAITKSIASQCSKIMGGG